MNCAVSGATLKERYGGETSAVWLDLFRQHRWDLEEELETLIANDQDDELGWFWIS